MIHYQTDDISINSFANELKGYNWSLFRSDAFAAVSVALLTVPQSMAYALLAGLPISCGIFAAIYSSLIAALFGSSKHLIVGPSNAIAILVQAGTSEILYAYYRHLTGTERDWMCIQILTQIAFIVGLFQLLAVGLKLGKITHFVSHAVVVGYVVGAAAAVLVSQTFTLLGIPNLPGIHSIYERGYYLATHLDAVHLPTAIIGAFSFIFLVTLRRVYPKLPSALIMLVLASLLVKVLEITFISDAFSFFDPYADEELNAVMLVGDTGSLSDVWPLVGLPYFDFRDMNILLPVAFAVALLSLMESSSIAKTIAASSGQKLSSNQEILGLGLGNLTSSLIGAMPVSASASRTCLNFNNGAQTRVAAVLNAIFVAILLVLLNAYISLIPLAALSALLFVTATTIVNRKHLLICLKATRSDAIVLLVTALSCIFFSFDMAFYIGVSTSIMFYLRKAGLPQLVEFEVDDSGELVNVDYCEIHNHRAIRIIKVEGELFFGAADLFQSTLKTLAKDDIRTKVIILQLKNARDIDATACLALQQLHDYLKKSNRYLIACGITQQVWDVLNDSGLLEQFGKDNLFIFDERHPHHYLHKALQRANELVNEAKSTEIGQEHGNERIGHGHAHGHEIEIMV